MTKRDEISATMAAALALAMEHGGKLSRHSGGYWSYAGWRHGNGEYFGTTTIESLVARGRLRYSQWRDGRSGQFPVEVEVVA